jgi:DNA-binding response OmpR family regulator
MAKILVAEDERPIGDMVAFKLTNSGHQVIRARDGEEALALAVAERPDLVLLDVMMPALNGFEVLQRLKADPALAAVPVIMLTAKGRERDVLTGLQAGAVDYIVKPFSLKELAARIETALRKG